MTELKKTLREQLAAFAEAGIVEEAARLLDKMLGGPQYRHGWRVAETLRLVAEENASVPGMGWMMLVADLVGVGGPQGVAGFGTARIAPFSGLGSGRKQANDGGCWMAAAVDAIYGVKFSLGVKDDAGYLLVDDQQVGFEALPLEWRKSLTANCLRAVAEGKSHGWHQLGRGVRTPDLKVALSRGPMGSPRYVPVQGTAAEWAAVLNLVLKEERQVAAEAARRRQEAETPVQEVPEEILGMDVEVDPAQDEPEDFFFEKEEVMPLTEEEQRARYERVRADYGAIDEED